MFGREVVSWFDGLLGCDEVVRGGWDAEEWGALVGVVVDGDGCV